MIVGYIHLLFFQEESPHMKRLKMPWSYCRTIGWVLVTLSQAFEVSGAYNFIACCPTQNVMSAPSLTS